MSNVSRGTGPNQDNTGRNTSKTILTPAYAAVLSFVTTTSDNLFIPALLTGNVTINAVISATGAPYIGDTVKMIFAGDGTARTVTFGTGFAGSATTLVLGVSKKAAIEFTFDGVAWIESNRAVGA